MSKSGNFITFEGGEGAGKTTQIQRLAEVFAHRNIGHLLTREPGGTPAAESIRSLIVTGDAGRWDAITESILLIAARHHHVTHAIAPALAAGKHVICDRFFDSTRVYQGIAKGVNMAWLESLTHLCIGTLEPDITFYLDIDPAIGLARTNARKGDENRFESLPLAFHQTLRDGFLSLAARFPERFITLDASQSQDAVHQAMIDALSERGVI